MDPPVKLLIFRNLQILIIINHLVFIIKLIKIFHFFFHEVGDTHRFDIWIWSIGHIKNISDPHKPSLLTAKRAYSLTSLLLSKDSAVIAIPVAFGNSLMNNGPITLLMSTVHARVTIYNQIIIFIVLTVANAARRLILVVFIYLLVVFYILTWQCFFFVFQIVFYFVIWIVLNY